MAYVQPNTLNQKASTIVIVAALHAVGLYAIIAGLSIGFAPPGPPPVISAKNFPLDPPKPTPTPKVIPSQTPPIDRTIFVPPPPGGTPPNPFATGRPFGEEGTGSGTLGGTGAGDVDIPDPIPDPTPRFTPRNPRAQGNRSLWVTTDDYPRREAEDGHEGLTGVRLNIGTNGRVTGCEVTSSSGWPNLDRAACTWLTRRARFEPATDNAGEVTAGHFNTSVRWQLPDE